ncbi:NAD(P)/FAD-dependent oxidoreductase [Thalassolituus sp. LLYu03]|uniref:NAD(P)/FAD-dependent oxidoreductase n=1 Tax=Thalassolituus sp. LLYu03 TaxID=3421656 RepID=UPI003D2E4619
MQADFDVCIIGGGVIGLAIARQLSAQASVLLVERHALFGSETSSRNSEVIHAGLYYPPGSLKETLCLRGKALLYPFCERYQVPHRAIGKLIVAPDAGHPKLRQLLEKGQRLGIPLQSLDQGELNRLEPQVKGGAALLSPTTGIIDSHAYLQTLASLAEQQGALLMKQTRFASAQAREGGWSIALETTDGACEISASVLVNAAGLSAQSVAVACGLAHADIPPLHLCRGHYFSYSGHSPFQRLIYPLPEENLAGLGIHATLDMGGQVRFGPDTDYLPEGSGADYSVDPSLRERFASAIQSYFPALAAGQLHPAYAGIRPKLHLAHEATQDFDIRFADHPAPAVHLFGIESPGLTSSLAIAEHVTGLLRMA